MGIANKAIPTKLINIIIIPQAFIQRLIGLCVGDAKLSLQEVVTHVTDLRKPPYCMKISGHVLF
jgi:hypothetical protein